MHNERERKPSSRKNTLDQQSDSKKFRPSAGETAAARDQMVERFARQMLNEQQALAAEIQTQM